jgi:hypothetical protein
VGGEKMPLFGRKEKAKDPLSNDVIMKCMCGMCPVQAESACSKPKLKMMMEMRSNMGMKGSGMPAGSMSLAQEQMEQMKPKPEEMPGPFCSIGVAACKDLDNSKACICNQCQVYKDFNLVAGKPVEHYCFNDKAM